MYKVWLLTGKLRYTEVMIQELKNFYINEMYSIYVGKVTSSYLAICYSLNTGYS